MIPCSDRFIKALKVPQKTVYLKFEFYDSAMKYIGEFTKNVTNDDLGALSVDATRAIRRSFNFSLNNAKGIFTWGEDKLIWIDKRIKLYFGLLLSDGTIEYVPQGVFILTVPQDEHSLDNGKVTTITGADKAYLLTDRRGKFVHQTTIAKDTPVTTAIKVIAGDAGETLYNFDNVTDTVPYEVTYDANSNRWDALTQLADFAKCIVYYDVNGYLRLEAIDLDEYTTRPECWSYHYGDPAERFYAGNIRKLDDTNMANAIHVVGGGSTIGVSSYDLIVDESLNSIWSGSPYSVHKIGYIWYFHNNGDPDPAMVNTDDCKFRAKYELMRRLGYSESDEVKIRPNPLHDAYDVIGIYDVENGLSDKYLLQSFSLPLNPDLMTMECLKYRQVVTDWNAI